MSEFDRRPVQPKALQPARYFAAGFAGEHVAGTEFVIGALFVAWGVSTLDIIGGLLIGNTLAVLTWALICAPIAADTRLTLYAYLEKIAGPSIVKLYSIVNGILFCVLAGAMITVSASAVRVLFGIEPQVLWYPTSPAFVLVALTVGAVVVFVAVRGFKSLSRFAEIAAPWMITMFLVGALVAIPTLIAATPGVDQIGSLSDFLKVTDSQVYVGERGALTLWHVAAFAWICNFAMHGALSDMTLLRFARRREYGWFSALGMFIGHYAAWICAGLMGAAAALMAQSSITQLDAGEVAFQALGIMGILAVIIAGWTTSNPTIYRAGLAFQSIYPKWSREKVTLIVGVATTIIACFPFVFTGLLDFLGLMALVLAPIGGIIAAEHWLFKPLGLTRYWNAYRGGRINTPVAISWILGLVSAFAMANFAGVHLFFLPPLIWILSAILYTLLAALFGARHDYGEIALNAETKERQRQAYERVFIDDDRGSYTGTPEATRVLRFLTLTGFMLLSICVILAVAVLKGWSLQSFQIWLILPSLFYFAIMIMRFLKTQP